MFHNIHNRTVAYVYIIYIIKSVYIMSMLARKNY